TLFVFGFFFKITSNSNVSSSCPVGFIIFVLFCFFSNRKPQVKLKQWDNETNFSVRLIDDDPTKPTIETEGNKIKFIKKDRECHFYDIEKGFEFEVILKKKPKTNKVQMSIESKGLKFYYQPELTQEEKDEGAFRPENVIGSYAVYHESKAGDYSKMGLKNYRAGKAFHIYRPKITDAVGNWVWEEMNIDVETGIITITIPQEFLDNAVYPVSSKGLTFGYETAGVTSYPLSRDVGDYDVFERYGYTEQASSNGGLDSIDVSISCDDSYNAKAFINEEDSEGSDSHGEVAQKENTGIATAKHWETFEISGSPSIVSGTDYVLGAAGDARELAIDNSAYIWLDTDEGNYNNYYEASYGADTSAYTTPEDPWTETSSSLARRFSIYCTYTASGAEERRMFLTQ
ncbi:hypothetical protein GQ568_03475, partial [Patescibacteria group bacterium]|nr:hypothetical protein [Patescibacteria group bacterium]